MSVMIGLSSDNENIPSSRASYTNPSDNRELYSQKKEIPKAEQDDYPMGHWKAWSTVFGGFLLTFCAGGIPASFGVFQDYYTSEWLNSFTPSDISWIGSTQLFLELGIAPIAGKLFDAGYFRLIIGTGCTVISFSYCMLSLAKQNQYYQVFLSQGIGLGIGIGLLYLPAATIVSQHFRKRKALAMGIVSSSAPAGGVIYSIMLNRLIHGSFGFAWGVRAVAFLTIGCLITANCLMFDPKTKSADSDRRPQELAATSDLHKEEFWDLPFILVLACAFLLNFGTYFPVFYLQLYAVSHGVDANLAFYSIAILNAASVFGRILPNYLADIFGSMNVFIACLTLNGAATFAMLACGHPIGLILFAITYGFSLGGTISSYLPMISSISGNRADIGKRMGVSLAPVGLACLIGSPISGATLGSELSWWKGITLASVTMLFSVICLLGVIILLRRRAHISA